MGKGRVRELFRVKMYMCESESERTEQKEKGEKGENTKR